MQTFWIGFEKTALNALKKHLLKSDKTFQQIFQASKKSRGKKVGGEFPALDYDHYLKGKNPEQVIKEGPSKGLPFSYAQRAKDLPIDVRISAKRKYKNRPGWFFITEGKGHHPKLDSKGRFAAIDAKKWSRSLKDPSEPLQEIGEASFARDPERGGVFSSKTQTWPAFQRQGVATALYDEAKQKGLRLKPSLDRTAQGDLLENAILPG